MADAIYKTNGQGFGWAIVYAAFACPSHGIMPLSDTVSELTPADPNFPECVCPRCGSAGGVVELTGHA